MIRSLLSLFLLFAAMSAGASLTVYPREAKDRVNRPGDDLRRVQKDSAMECSEACSGDRRCLSWTWVRAGVQGPRAMCWIKGGVPAAVADRCCVSGVKPPTGRKEADIDRPGRDYKSFVMTSTNANLCESACFDDRKCAAWTFVKPSGGGSPRCFLKSDVPDPVPNRCCISGAKPPP